ASSPAFVNMLMWPMSDVPVATCWLAALVSLLDAGPWRALRTGGCLSAAVLVRPNLAPLVALFVAWIWYCARDRGERWRDLGRLPAGLVPGPIPGAPLHTTLYGHR